MYISRWIVRCALIDGVEPAGVILIAVEQHLDRVAVNQRRARRAEEQRLQDVVGMPVVSSDLPQMPHLP